MVSFDLKRALLTAAFVASSAWLSSRNAPPKNDLDSNSHVREVRRGDAEAPLAIESLHDWRPRPIAPLPRTRNLFAFGAAPKHDVTRTPPVDRAPPEAPPSLPAPPALTLVGLAEDPGLSGPTRTAIISGAGQLFVVTEGDQVTSRYRVASVSAGVVDLTDLQTGGTLRLAFK